MAKQSYGINEIFSNGIAFLYTKLFWKNARLIRRPVYIRGKKNLQYGKGFTTGYSCRIENLVVDGHQGKTIIGTDCRIGDRVHITSVKRVEIGANCLLASNILISDNEHGIYKGTHQCSPYEEPNRRKLRVEPVKIGDRVWIGENVVILPGAQIGDGCVIGANSVVKGKFPNNCIIAGCPAKIVKTWVGNEKKGSWLKYSLKDN